ncbi:hypothetical protein M8850_03155 [Pasteurella multocida]|uniref:hypothetical protein n=1 Tax=Pasteurella multocida TaxID=747 RepID=UPI0020237652|nr:hypothetical protein [Pasteurella multocida]MEB3483834.1 hypothetical protein [Pasteurella multocida]MEB3495722.1 hypothetical protein [Pasteurella multocida]URH94739.1 hypothetical protein M8850_03155 [Pasteurella multocida]URI01130.1 hypothetical protein M8851_03160 [Pasteurella multocida]HDR1796601.1 hypothetical protein [Pasteurella multocida]
MPQIKDKAIIKIPHSQFKTMFINHIRYCMTRHSYLVAQGIRDVKQYWNILESSERDCIKRDISEHLDFYKCQRDSDEFGDDYKCWGDLLNWCIAQDKSAQPAVNILPVIDYPQN